MAYQRPSIAATDEECIHSPGVHISTDAWPDKRALYPKEGQETKEQKACLPRSRLFEFFETGEPSHYILISGAQDLGLLRVSAGSEG